jgi:hypothetical protein
VNKVYVCDYVNDPMSSGQRAVAPKIHANVETSRSSGGALNIMFENHVCS